jgi:hypothetical protein
MYKEVTDIELDKPKFKQVDDIKLDEVNQTQQAYENMPQFLKTLGMYGRGVVSSLATPIDLLQAASQLNPMRAIYPLPEGSPEGSPEFQAAKAEMTYPASQRIKDFIDKISYGELAPKEASGRYLTTASEFVGGAKALNKVLPTKTKDMPALVGAAAGTQTAREADLGVAGEIIGGVAGAMAGGRITQPSVPKPTKTKPITPSVDSPQALAKAELQKRITVENAQRSLDRINELSKLNIKTPLATSIESNDLFKLGDIRAQALGGAEVAGQSLSKTITDITKAESEFINKLAANSKSVLDDAQVFQNSASSIKKALVDARKARAEVLFGQIKDKKIPPSLYKSLQRYPDIANAMEQGFKNFSTIAIQQELKPNSLGALHLAKMQLDDAIGAAKRSGNNTAMANGIAAKKLLEKATTQYVPNYRKALDAYADDSSIIEGFVGKSPKSPLAKIISLSGEDATKAYNEIFSLQPEQIARMRKSFKTFGQESAFDSLTRGFITNKLVNAKDGATFGTIFKNQAIKQRMEAAIGDKNKIKLFQDVLDTADVLQRSKAMHPLGGSRTFAAGNVEKQILEGGRTRAEMTLTIPATIVKKVKKVFGGEVPEELFQKEEYLRELDKLLFTDSGKVFLEEYIKASKAVKPQTIKMDIIKKIMTTAKTNYEKNAVANTQTLIQAGE